MKLSWCLRLQCLLPIGYSFSTRNSWGRKGSWEGRRKDSVLRVSRKPSLGMNVKVLLKYALKKFPKNQTFRRCPLFLSGLKATQTIEEEGAPCETSVPLQTFSAHILTNSYVHTIYNAPQFHSLPLVPCALWEASWIFPLVP